MRYLVVGTGGPGFSSADEAVDVLQHVILPSFKMLAELEKKKKILAGGLPVGDRAFVFIVNAKTNEDVDRMLRDLPMWGALEWEVTPLQTFSGRARIEREAVREIKRAARR